MNGRDGEKTGHKHIYQGTHFGSVTGGNETTFFWGSTSVSRKSYRVIVKLAEEEL